MNYRTEYNLPDEYAYILESVVAVNMLWWVNVNGHRRRKAVGFLSLSVPVCGQSCWYS